MMLIKIPLFLPVNDENSFNQNFFLVRQQSGRVKRHAYSYVFLLRPPLPKARCRGGRQFFSSKITINFLRNELGEIAGILHVLF